MNNEELYNIINYTHDVRVMIGGEIYSKADFAREHNAIQDAWETGGKA